jgi:zinc protease
MKRTLLAFALMAAGLCAQTPPAPARTPARPSAAGKPAGSPASAAAPSPKDLKFPPLRPVTIPEVTTFTLPNGMRVYLLEDHELPVVNGFARVRTGNLFDPPAKIGLASLTGEVMRTGGTQTKTGSQWDVELENMASSVESEIDETYANVSFSSLKENADATMAVFKDALTAPEFRQDKVDLAKLETRGGISRRNDDARAIADREFTNTVYGKDTPYGWQLEYATLARITRADMQEFHRRYFFPKNTLLAVWGDFDTASMKTRLETLFASWTVEQPAVPPFAKVRTTTDPGAFLAVKKDVTQTFFSIGQMGGEVRDKDLAALDVMASILGGGFQSRLTQRIRSNMGDAYDISASWEAQYDHPGLFVISGGTKSSATVRTIKAALEEVERLRTAEVTEAELKAAKDTALNSFVFAFDTKAKTLGRMLTYEYNGYPKDFIQQYQRALAAVTRADVLRVAKQRLSPENFTIIAVGDPDGFAQPLDALGAPPHEIDLTIPEPESAPVDAASVARGQQLLELAQKAVGGAEKLTAITDFTEISEMQVSAQAGGMRAKATDRWLAPSIFRQDQELPVGHITAFLNGRYGWIATPQGSGPLTGTQLKQVQGDHFRLYFRLLLGARLEGRVVNGVDDRTVEIRGATGEVAELVVDPATGMPQGVRYNVAQAAGGSVAVEDAWSDFREVNGVKVPFKTVITRNGGKFADVTVTKCEVNTGLKQEELQIRP